LSPSLHEATATQVLLLHNALVQSLPERQALPMPHLPQMAPPQSTSVSEPFFVLSVHDPVAATQTLPLQLLDRQSELVPQLLPSPHLPQVEPPQSTSVSVPSFVPFEHEAGGCVHTLFEHNAVVQSAAPRQLLPVLHLGQEAPPQSTSVSVPFFTLSVQVGCG
jgi:hypothetical protein